MMIQQTVTINGSVANIHKVQSRTYLRAQLEVPFALT